YVLVPAPPEALDVAVAVLRGEGYAGANVTVPHKEAIIPLLDGLTPVAEAIGAVNTIVARVGAKHPSTTPLRGSAQDASPLRLIGHNTDAAGLLADLYLHNVHISDRPVLILGAGGSARAAVAACAGVGAHMRVAARRREQAEALKTLAPSLAVFDLTVNDLKRAGADCALIINCTPLGMSPNVNASPWFEGAPFPAGAFVYDLVYNPFDTLLTRQARASGLRAATGLGMLVEQGALAFELWTGKTAPRALVRAIAEKRLFTTENTESAE
ncbi:MAG: shikimate dehydrogenase, partial [Chloroflexi bacterium]|nr:shikimate dehydrogenase [Chloroflexota bacterium]